MYRKTTISSTILSLFLISIVTAGAEVITTSWKGDAEMIYDTGFMHMLRKHPGSGVCLFNMELIENDSPGAGWSEKGVNCDAVWGNNWARKQLYLDDARAEKAYLVFFFTYEGKGEYPLQFKVNGHHNQCG